VLLLFCCAPAEPVPFWGIPHVPEHATASVSLEVEGTLNWL
jgi:hypothetical protein